MGKFQECTEADVLKHVNLAGDRQKNVSEIQKHDCNVIKKEKDTWLSDLVGDGKNSRRHVKSIEEDV